MLLQGGAQIGEGAEPPWPPHFNHWEIPVTLSLNPVSWHWSAVEIHRAVLHCAMLLDPCVTLALYTYITYLLTYSFWLGVEDGTHGGNVRRSASTECQAASCNSVEKVFK